jgi:hypothetical protein
MKTISAIPILLLILLMNGCVSPDKWRIKKDLKTRYIKFEIVEIKKDSSNREEAWKRIIRCKLIVADNNCNISEALLDYEIKKSGYNISGLKISSEERKKWTLKQYRDYVNSLYKKSEDALKGFEDLRFSKSYNEQCYYVKYRIFKEENKVQKEDYYFTNKNNNYVVHRAYDWNEFLFEAKYSDLINEALKYYPDILDLGH